MIKKRTKTPFPVPNGRGVIPVIIRFIIDKISINQNNIIPEGYYYYLDEHDRVVQLDSIGMEAMKGWDIIDQIENNGIVPSLKSSTNLKENIYQRLQEFTDLQFHQESGENYGTTPEDWENDI